jgi:hypothetical protein
LVSQGAWGNRFYSPDFSLKFLYFQEWVAHFPGFADRLGNPELSITITGNGFNNQIDYRCNFEMNSDPPKYAQSSSVVISSKELACSTPEWDSVTPWIAYKSNVVNISLVSLRIKNHAIQHLMNAIFK